MYKISNEERFLAKVRSSIVNQMIRVMDNDVLNERIEICVDTEYGDTYISLVMETQSMEFELNPSGVFLSLQEISHSGMKIHLAGGLQNESILTALENDLRKLFDVFMADCHNYMYVLEGLARYSSKFELNADGICELSTWHAMHQYYEELKVLDEDEDQ